MRKLFLLMFVFASLSSTGQVLPSNVQFEHIPIPGSIRSSEVLDIMQDPYGYIWFIGNYLYKYDGISITTYSNFIGYNKGSTKDLQCLLYDHHRNRILIGTRKNGVLEYSYETNEIRTLPTKGKIPVINSFAQLNSGKVWGISFNSGISAIENDTLSAQEDLTGRLSFPSTIAAKGNSLMVDYLNRIFLLKDEVIYDSIVFNLPDVDPGTFRASALLYDSKGQLWVGTERHGVLVYDTISNSVKKHFKPSEAPFYNRILKIIEDKSGLIWILAKGNGIVLYSPQEDNYLHITRDPFISNSISGNNCKSIIQDRTGNIWIGSTGDLNKYNPNKTRFDHYNNQTGPKKSLTDNMVRSMYEANDGVVWMGTDGGYINQFDPTRKEIQAIKINLDNKFHFVALSFRQLNKIEMLVGTNIGLLVYNTKSNRFKYFEPLKEKTKGIPVRQIVQIKNKLLVLCQGKLIVLDLNTNESVLTSTFGQSEKYRANLTALFVDSKENLWLGVPGGVTLFNLEDLTGKYFRLYEDADAFTGNYLMILSLIEYQQELYIGTLLNGWWKMDIADPQNPGLPINLSVDGQLLSNTAYSSLPDDQGNFWLSTNQGIHKYDGKRNRFISFNEFNNVQNDEFNRLAFARLKDGTMVFGGVNGINVFHPDSINIYSGDFRPVLSSAIINSSTLKSPQNSYVSLLDKKSLVLSYDQNFIDLSYFVPDYIGSSRYILEFILKGYEESWRSSVDNVASYSNLRPGNYSFLVRSTDVLGMEKKASIPIKIHAPYYQTAWFYGVVLLSFFGLTFIFAKIYTWKTLREKDKLEGLLKLRTEEIHKSREELENLNQKKDLIFSILSHDLRGPLTTLKGFLGLLVDNADVITREELKLHASGIRNNVTNSLDLIDNTLYWSMSQTGTIQYNPVSVDINGMLEKMRGLYELTAKRKKIDLSFELNGAHDIHIDENMIMVVFRNLISNALKFTPEGKKVTIVVGKNEKMAEISISDEGVGISEEEAAQLFSTDNPVIHKGTSSEKGTGLGLLLCRKFVLLNHGSLTYQSEVGVGTKFVVQLPLAAI